MPRQALDALQRERLINLVHRVHAGSAFHRQRLSEADVDPTMIRGVEDLEKLPFTTKADLRQTYPLGMLVAKPSELVRVHASSGTTGKPTVVGYTRADLDLWAELMARKLCTVGVGPGVIVHNAYGYGLFTGGLGFQGGADRLGALVVPAGLSPARLQATLLRDLGAGVLLSTPSYAMTLAEAVNEAGLDARSLPLSAGIFGGEPWSEALRGRIEQAFGLIAYDTYGLSEIIGPGVAQECSARRGLHVYEDHFLVEIVDPESNKKLPDGAAGEIVLTTLTKEAMPVIRYRTGDLASLSRAPCPCGRTLARITRVHGRRGDAITVGGRLLSPSRLEEVVLSVPGTAAHYEIVLREGAEPSLRVEAARGAGALPALEAALTRALRGALGFTLDVRAVPEGELPRSQGKARRVIEASQ